MLVPIQIESNFGVADNSFVSDPYTVVENYVNTYINFNVENEGSDDVANVNIAENVLETENKTLINNPINKVNIALMIYIFGAAIVLSYIIISNILFGKRIRQNGIEIEINSSDKQVFKDQEIKQLKVCLIDGIQSPCLLGVIRPKILLNSKSAENEKIRRYSLYHETTHYKHKDNLVFLIGLLACIINWFNPIMWLALNLCKKDREIYCDESVVKLIGDDNVIEYGKSLLFVAQNNNSKLLTVSTTMTGGKKEMKHRINNLVVGRKRWIIFSGLITAIVIALLFVTGIIKSPIKQMNSNKIERIIDLDEYPEYIELFDESRDQSSITIHEIYKTDIDNDGVDELYTNSGVKGMYLSSPDFVECYNLKKDTYSKIIDTNGWYYRFIKYNEQLYVFSLDMNNLADRDAYRVYEPKLAFDKLSIEEIDSDLENEIVEFVGNTISVGVYGKADGPTALYTHEDIVDISIYDISSSEEVLLHKYTQEDEEVMKGYIPLYSKCEFIDMETVEQPFKAIINFDQAGVKHIDIVWFGDKEHITVYRGRWKNDEMLNYLNQLAKGQDAS